MQGDGRISRLAVLGGSGFLGRHLIGRLAVGAFEVISVDRAPVPAHKEQFRGAKALVVDLTDKGAVAECCRMADVVWIRAAILGGANSVDIRKADAYITNNVSIVLNVLDAWAATADGRILFDSSEQAFGLEGESILPGPATDPTPMNFYGVSKVVAEKALRLWAMGEERRSVQIFRYSRVRTGTSKDVIYHMTKACLRGDPLRIFGNPDRRISFVHLDDAMRVNLAALERTPRFEIHHVSSDERISLGELAQRVQKVVGRRTDIEELPPPPGPPFESSNVGMEWRQTAETLGVWPQWSLDDMIRQTVECDPLTF